VVPVVVVVEGVVVDDIAGFQIVNLQNAVPVKRTGQLRLFLEASHLHIQDFPFHNIDRQYPHLLIVLYNRFHLESIDNFEHRKPM
jgi:hypothetical protein